VKLVEICCARWQEFVGKRDAEAARLGLLVRSGLYEVDLLLRLMTPGYWPEAQHRVLRGTWFVEKGHDWVPLKETVRRRRPSLRIGLSPSMPACRLANNPPQAPVSALVPLSPLPLVRLQDM